MEKRQAMKRIVERLGRDRAIELVMNAYNTELIASWLRHIESSQAGKVARAERRDHLGNALDRVSEVCGLAD